MDAEKQRARQLADLLDNFRPEEERLSVEEREFLKLGGQLSALQADKAELAELRDRLPKVQATKSNRRFYWRGVLTGAAAVATLLLAALGIDWLISGSLPFAAARRQDVTPSVLAIAPKACVREEAGRELPLGYRGLGGGELQSGDFTIQMWLTCNSNYSRSATSPQFYSAIDGLVVNYSWVYNGEQGAMIEGIALNIEPYWVSEDYNSDPMTVPAGFQYSGADGLKLPTGVFPDWKRTDAHLRMALKIKSSDGAIEGVALTFTLKRVADGFEPVDIAVEPLTEAERASMEGNAVTEPPFPLITVGEFYPELKEVEALLARREEQLTAGGGWIHGVVQFLRTTQKGAGLEREDPDFNYWALVDPQGRTVAYATGSRDGEGNLNAYAIYNGTYRSTAGVEVSHTTVPPNRGWQDILQTLIQTLDKGGSIESTYEVSDGRTILVLNTHPPRDIPIVWNGANYFDYVVRYSFDVETGAFLYISDIIFDGDGSEIEFERTVVTEESVQQPPEEILALFDEPLPSFVPESADEDFHLPGAALWQGPKLAPEVCSGRAMDDNPDVYERLGIGNLNGNLLGGGQIESGDFTFDYWLVCDFQLENSSRNLQSEISGLGMALKWAYTGAGQDGQIAIYSGIEPYLSESLFGATADANQSGNEFRGIELPGLMLADWYAQDTPLRYTVKAVLPDGSIAGAALTFTLVRGEDGFRPEDIRLEPLTEAELASPTGVAVSEAPFALLDMDVEYPELADIHALITRHNLELLSGAGWIHRTVEMEGAGEGYRRELWTQLGETGNVLGEVQQTFRDGELVSQSVNQSSEAGLSEGYRLVGSLLDAARYGAPAVESLETIDGRAVRVFTFPNELTNGPIYRESIDGLVYAMTTREGVDARTGEFLFSETQELDENGALVVSSRSTWSEERKKQAPDEVSNLLASPPQGEDYPNMPLEVLAWSCANPQTDETPTGGEMAIGGGTLVSGDFEFELWVICADRFSRAADIYGDDYSLIDHLGLSVRWQYLGAALEGHVTPYGGIEPYVEQLFDGATMMPIEPGLSSDRQFGLRLPRGVIADWGKADTQLRYAVKVQLPDGTIEGAVLVFSLMRSPEGLAVWAVAAESLSEVERSGGTAAEVSKPPFALIPMGVQYPALAEIWPLIERRMAEFIGAGGWFHNAWETDGGEITEGWYQVDERGKVTRMLMGMRDAGGALKPSMVYQDGYMNNVGGDESGYWPPYDMGMFEYGVLIDDLMQYAPGGLPLQREEVNEGGRRVWVYSIPRQFSAMNIGGEGVRVNRYGLDAESGELLWQERYEGKDDASLALVSRTERVVDERLDVPPEEVLQLMEKLGR